MAAFTGSGTGLRVVASCFPLIFTIMPPIASATPDPEVTFPGVLDFIKTINQVIHLQCCSELEATRCLIYYIAFDNDPDKKSICGEPSKESTCEAEIDYSGEIAYIDKIAFMDAKAADLLRKHKNTATRLALNALRTITEAEQSMKCARPTRKQFCAKCTNNHHFYRGHRGGRKY